MVYNHAQVEDKRCFIIGSPGFVKDQCYQALKDYYLRNASKSLNMTKVLLVHTSNGYKDALLEACADPSV